MNENMIEKIKNNIQNYNFEFWYDWDIENNCKELLYLLQKVDTPFKIQNHWNYNDWYYYIVEYYENKIKHFVEIYDSDFELECVFMNENDIIKLIEKINKEYEKVKSYFIN